MLSVTLYGSEAALPWGQSPPHPALSAECAPCPASARTKYVREYTCEMCRRRPRRSVRSAKI